MDLVSIIVPSKNRPSFLKTTLACLSSQTFNSEIIVCDDNSSPENAIINRAICEASGAKYIFNPGPHGVSSARNYAVRKSTGNYISFCDDDDFWTPEKLENQMLLIKKSKGIWGYSATVIIDDEFNIRRVEYGRSCDSEKIRSANRIPGGCSSVVVKRNAFDRAGGFDSELKMYADWDLWLRLYELEPPIASYSLDVFYLVHENQMSSDFKQAKDELQLVFNKYGIQRSDFRESLLDIDRWICQRYLLCADRKSALEHAQETKNSIDTSYIFFLTKILLYPYFNGYRALRALYNRHRKRLREAHTSVERLRTFLSTKGNV